MKKPSRNMPKYVPEKTNPFYMAILIGLVVAILYFSPEVAYVFAGIFVLIILYEYLNKPEIDKHFEDLCQSRKTLSICDFAKEFNCNEIDTWVIRAVYEQIQEYLPYEKPIPIKSTDHLENDLGIDDEDLEMDIAAEIAQRTGRSFEGSENNPYYGKVTTVRDLVLFFNQQPKNNKNQVNQG